VVRIWVVECGGLTLINGAKSTTLLHGILRNLLVTDKHQPTLLSRWHDTPVAYSLPHVADVSTAPMKA
jgi:hypothetical protein